MTNPILLICQGRSGSTTLLRIFNSIDNCNICGENWNMIESLMEFYERLKKTKAQPGFTNNYSDAEYPSWYNVFDINNAEKD